jgi:hypothetical protein
MAVVYIARTTEILTNAVTAAATTATAGITPFSLNSASGALLMCSATSTAAAMVVKFSAGVTRTGPFYELRDATNTAISLTVAPNGCYDLPEQLFASPYIAITTPAAGNTATFTISTKS